MLPRTCPAILIVALLSVVAQAEWTNSLKPPGKPADPVKIVEAGRPACVIVCPAQPTTMEQKAVEDLQHWVSETTGVKLDVISVLPSGNCIIIRTDPSLGPEGIEISARPDRITLAGGSTRGVINAVYALLEEDVGCRFYTNDSIRLPKSDTLAVAPVARRYIPALKIRDPFYRAAFDPTWSLRNRTNAPDAHVAEEHGGHVDYGGMFVHTAAQILPPDRYFKDHPEYFAVGGDGKRTTAQLCPTEPAVVKIAIDHVRDVLRKSPHTEILSVSKNDNTQVCGCERCRKLRDAEGSDMANQLFLVNQVAEAIERDYPNVVIDTLAYLETIQVPRTVRPRRNVVIRLCNDSVGSWVHPLTPAGKCDVARLLAAWSAVHDRMSIWDYTVNFSHYLAPMPNIDVIAANIRFWVDNHAEGVMLQGGYQGPAERDELKCWVASKLLWDPRRDETALVEDFTLGHYGKAAQPLLDYESLLAGLRGEYGESMASPPGGIRYPMDAPFISAGFLDRATRLFARAAELARGDEALIRRVERAYLPILYARCSRGPQPGQQDYAEVVAEFERIARREKIQFLQEGGPDFDPKLAGYKEKAKVKK
jgi:hypothetical protein